MFQNQNFTVRKFMLSTKFELYHYINTNPLSISKHHHEFYELYHFLLGEVEYEIGDFHCKLYPGDTLLIAPHVLHKPLINSDIKYERVVLWINEELIQQSLSNFMAHSHEFNLPNGFLCVYHWQDREKEIGMQLQKLEKLKREKTSYNDVCCTSLISYLFSLCFSLSNTKQIDAYEQKNSPLNAFKRKRFKNVIISQIIQYIDDNLHEDITIKEISKNFNISLYYLNHQFKLQTELSPYQYILQNRLMMAKNLLTHGEAPTNAAIKSGFQDYSCFFRAFKKKYSLTPSEYINSIQ